MPRIIKSHLLFFAMWMGIRVKHKAKSVMLRNRLSEMEAVTSAMMPCLMRISKMVSMMINPTIGVRTPIKIPKIIEFFLSYF